MLWACDEPGISFRREECGEGFKSPQEAEFKALNPKALIAVMMDADFILWESNTIIRYLANAHGGETFYPTHPQYRPLQS